MKCGGQSLGGVGLPARPGSSVIFRWNESEEEFLFVSPPPPCKLGSAAQVQIYFQLLVIFQHICTGGLPGLK